MSFNMGDHAESPGFGKYEAEVVNAGVAHGEYGDQMIFVVRPKNEKMNIQTIFLSMGKGKYVFDDGEERITIGKGSERAFEITIFKVIVSGPKIPIISKAGLFLNALKHLGVDVKGSDMRIYLGLKLELEDVTHNEAIRRFNEAHPDIKDISELSKGYAEKSGNITMPVTLLGKKKSLKQEVLEFMGSDFKTEGEVIDWCKASKKGMKGVFDTIAEAEEIEETIRGPEKTMTFHVKTTKQKIENKQLEKEIEEEFSEEFAEDKE